MGEIALIPLSMCTLHARCGGVRLNKMGVQHKQVYRSKVKLTVEYLIYMFGSYIYLRELL